MKKKLLLGVAAFAVAVLLVPRSASAENGACTRCENLKLVYTQSLANGNSGAQYSAALLYSLEFCWWNNGSIDQNPPSYCDGL